MKADVENGLIARVLPVLELLSRWVLGLLFIYAGVQKIIDPYGFAKTIYGYGILPGDLVNITGIVLPWVEVMAGGGFCLACGPPRRRG